MVSRNNLVPSWRATAASTGSEYSQVILRDVSLRLEYQQELLGEARVVGAEVRYARAQVVFEPAIQHRLLRWVTDRLTPTSGQVQIDASLSGLACYWLDPDTPSSHVRHRMVNDPEPGIWKEFVVAPSQTAILQIPRADWYGQVLGPTRDEHYRYLEVALPQNDEALRQEWANAVSHIDNVERSYASGDDVAVLSHLRAPSTRSPARRRRSWTASRTHKNASTSMTSSRPQVSSSTAAAMCRPLARLPEPSRSIGSTPRLLST